LFSIASIVPDLPRIKIVDVGAADTVEPPATTFTGALLRRRQLSEAAVCEKLNALSRPAILTFLTQSATEPADIL
jgi:hypothetical protein